MYTLQRLLKEGEYVYVLERACVQFEPDDPKFIEVNNNYWLNYINYFILVTFAQQVCVELGEVLKAYDSLHVFVWPGMQVDVWLHRKQATFWRVEVYTSFWQFNVSPRGGKAHWLFTGVLRTAEKVRVCEV